jgi:hypothetical protein
MVLNAMPVSINFFADLEEIHNFFNKSINRTADRNSTANLNNSPEFNVINEFTYGVPDCDTDSDDTDIGSRRLFHFSFKRVGRVPPFFGKFASDSRSQDTKERFTVKKFY